jgi:hypothetical protein
VAKKAVGNKPALIGKILTTYHRDVENRWFEVCVDVGSSKVAGAMMGAVKGFASTLTLQLGFLIEGQCEDDLPERMLGGVTICTPQMTPVPQPPPGVRGAAGAAAGDKAPPSRTAAPRISEGDSAEEEGEQGPGQALDRQVAEV